MDLECWVGTLLLFSALQDQAPIKADRVAFWTSGAASPPPPLCDARAGRTRIGLVPPKSQVISVVVCHAKFGMFDVVLWNSVP